MTNPIDSREEPQPAWPDFDDALRSFFGRRVPASDVEDLLQEHYVRVARGLADLQDHDRLAGWIFQIARNLVVDYLRRKPTQPQELVDPPSTEADDLGPDNLSSRISGWLAGIIDQLPEKYAEVLRDSELKQLPHREIAERLSLSVSGVKSRVQRGRAMLRDKLEACCKFEFDRRGGIRDFERKRPDDGECCGPKDGCS